MWRSYYIFSDVSMSKLLNKESNANAFKRHNAHVTLLLLVDASLFPPKN